jgi:hypothetical protein
MISVQNSNEKTFNGNWSDVIKIDDNTIKATFDGTVNNKKILISGTWKTIPNKSNDEFKKMISSDKPEEEILEAIKKTIPDIIPKDYYDYLKKNLNNTIITVIFTKDGEENGSVVGWTAAQKNIWEKNNEGRYISKVVLNTEKIDKILKSVDNDYIQRNIVLVDPANIPLTDSIKNQVADSNITKTETTGETQDVIKKRLDLSIEIIKIKIKDIGNPFILKFEKAVTGDKRKQGDVLQKKALILIKSKINTPIESFLFQLDEIKKYIDITKKGGKLTQNIESVVTKNINEQEEKINQMINKYIKGQLSTIIEEIYKELNSIDKFVLIEETVRQSLLKTPIDKFESKPDDLLYSEYITNLELIDNIVELEKIEKKINNDLTKKEQDLKDINKNAVSISNIKISEYRNLDNVTKDIIKISTNSVTESKKIEKIKIQSNEIVQKVNDAIEIDKAEKDSTNAVMDSFSAFDKAKKQIDSTISQITVINNLITQQTETINGAVQSKPPLIKTLREDSIIRKFDNKWYNMGENNKILNFFGNIDAVEACLKQINKILPPINFDCKYNINSGLSDFIKNVIIKNFGNNNNNNIIGWNINIFLSIIENIITDAHNNPEFTNIDKFESFKDKIKNIVWNKCLESIKSSIIEIGNVFESNLKNTTGNPHLYDIIFSSIFKDGFKKTIQYYQDKITHTILSYPANNDPILQLFVNKRIISDDDKQKIFSSITEIINKISMDVDTKLITDNTNGSDKYEKYINNDILVEGKTPPPVPNPPVTEMEKLIAENNNFFTAYNFIYKKKNGVKVLEIYKKNINFIFKEIIKYIIKKNLLLYIIKAISIAMYGRMIIIFNIYALGHNIVEIASDFNAISGHIDTEPGGNLVKTVGTILRSNVLYSKNSNIDYFYELIENLKPLYDNLLDIYTDTIYVMKDPSDIDIDYLKKLYRRINNTYSVLVETDLIINTVFRGDRYNHAVHPIVASINGTYLSAMFPMMRVLPNTILATLVGPGVVNITYDNAIEIINEIENKIIEYCNNLKTTNNIAFDLAQTAYDRANENNNAKLVEYNIVKKLYDEGMSNSLLAAQIAVLRNTFYAVEAQYRGTPVANSTTEILRLAINVYDDATTAKEKAELLDDNVRKNLIVIKKIYDDHKKYVDTINEMVAKGAELVGTHITSYIYYTQIKNIFSQNSDPLVLPVLKSIRANRTTDPVNAAAINTAANMAVPNNVVALNLLLSASARRETIAIAKIVFDKIKSINNNITNNQNFNSNIITVYGTLINNLINNFTDDVAFNNLITIHDSLKKYITPPNTKITDIVTQLISKGQSSNVDQDTLDKILKNTNTTLSKELKFEEILTLDEQNEFEDAKQKSYDSDNKLIALYIAKDIFINKISFKKKYDIILNLIEKCSSIDSINKDIVINKPHITLERLGDRTLYMKDIVEKITDNYSSVNEDNILKILNELEYMSFYNSYSNIYRCYEYSVKNVKSLDKISKYLEDDPSNKEIAGTIIIPSPAPNTDNSADPTATNYINYLKAVATSVNAESIISNEAVKNRYFEPGVNMFWPNTPRPKILIYMDIVLKDSTEILNDCGKLMTVYSKAKKAADLEKNSLLTFLTYKKDFEILTKIKYNIYDLKNSIELLDEEKKERNKLLSVLANIDIKNKSLYTNYNNIINKISKFYYKYILDDILKSINNDLEIDIGDTDTSTVKRGINNELKNLVNTLLVEINKKLNEYIDVINTTFINTPGWIFSGLNKKKDVIEFTDNNIKENIKKIRDIFLQYLTNSEYDTFIKDLIKKKIDKNILKKLIIIRNYTSYYFNTLEAEQLNKYLNFIIESGEKKGGDIQNKNIINKKYKIIKKI